MLTNMATVKIIYKAFDSFLPITLLSSKNFFYFPGQISAIHFLSQFFLSIYLPVPPPPLFLPPSLPLPLLRLPSDAHVGAVLGLLCDGIRKYCSMQLWTRASQ